MKKKISFIILLITMLLLSAFPAFAEEKSTHDTAYEMYLEIFNEAEELPEADRERVRKIANAMWALEEKEILAADYPGTIEDGMKLISSATKQGYELTGLSKIFTTDANAGIFISTWQNMFHASASAMGMDPGDPFTAMLGGSGSTLTSSASQIEDNASNANILTWNADPDGDSKKKGQISTILNIFDVGFKDFSSIIIGLSIALAIAYGGANIISLSMERNASGDALTREFFKLLLGIWVMCNYRYFAILLIRLGTLLTETVQKVGIEGASKTASYQTSIAIWESLKELLSQISSPNSIQSDLIMGRLPLATQSISFKTSNTLLDLIAHAGGNVIFNFVTSLIIYAVAIEIGIRFLFTPIAIADLYSERTRSSGFNWLKKLLAVSLQGAIIFLMIYGSTKLKNSMGVNATAINLCTLGMLAGSKMLANEIVGAH